MDALITGLWRFLKDGWEKMSRQERFLVLVGIFLNATFWNYLHR